SKLLHAVESRASLEPGDLLLVGGVVDRNVEWFSAVVWCNSQSQRLAWCELLQSENGDAIVSTDAVVVSWVGEGEWEHTLLLEVGLVNSRERLRDDCHAAQVTRLERRVLAGRSLTVVLITDHHPVNAVSLVLSGDSRNLVKLASEDVLDLVG